MKYADRRWNPLAGCTRYEICNREHLPEMFPVDAEAFVAYPLISGPGPGSSRETGPLTVGYLAKRKADGLWVCTLASGNGWRAAGAPQTGCDRHHSIVLGTGHRTPWLAYVATRKATYV